MKAAVLFLSALLLASGCCSINVSREGDRTMCVVSNSGWRLWDIFPIVAGDPDSKDAAGCTFFSDAITLETNEKLMDMAMRRAGANRVRFQNSYMTDEQTLFTFYRRTYYTSAELVFDQPDPAESPE